MNKKMVVRELLKLAKELTAGELFTNQARDINDGYKKMMYALKTVENHINYQLYGEGSTDIHGEPTLNPDKYMKARHMLNWVMEVRRVMEKEGQQVRGDFARELAKLDKMLSFT